MVNSETSIPETPWQPDTLPREVLALDPHNDADLSILAASRNDAYLALLLLTRQDIIATRKQYRLERPSIQGRLLEGVELEIARRHEQLDNRQ